MKTLVQNQMRVVGPTFGIGVAVTSDQGLWPQQSGYKVRRQQQQAKNLRGPLLEQKSEQKSPADEIKAFNSYQDFQKDWEFLEQLKRKRGDGTEIEIPVQIFKRRQSRGGTQEEISQGDIVQVKFAQNLGKEFRYLQQFSNCKGQGDVYHHFKEIEKTSQKSQMIMEYLPQSLNDIIKFEMKYPTILTTNQANNYQTVYYQLDSLLQLLVKMEEIGVVHADIKAENILVNYRLGDEQNGQDQKTVLIDFGSQNCYNFITAKPKKVLGTLGYQAQELLCIEQALGQDYNITEQYKKQDVYSQGLTIQEVQIVMYAQTKDEKRYLSNLFDTSLVVQGRSRDKISRQIQRDYFINPDRAQCEFQHHSTRFDNQLKDCLVNQKVPAPLREIICGMAQYDVKRRWSQKQQFDEVQRVINKESPVEKSST